MTKYRTTTATSLWHRATHALGRLWAEVISSPDDRRPNADRRAADAYPRFPMF